MADQGSNDLTIPKSDAGLAFRLEMWASNTILGYWWVLALAIAAILAGVAIYAIWDGTNTSSQRRTSLESAVALSDLSEAVLDEDKLREREFVQTENGPFRQFQFVPTLGYADMDASGYPPKVYIPLASATETFGKDDGNRESALIDGADRMMKAYNGGSGLAADHAALQAAQLYSLAGNDEGRDKALAAARQSGDSNVRFAAEAQLAAMAVAAEDVAGAEALLRPWISEENGFSGQRAAMALGEIYEGADRAGDAEAVYRELLATWPLSSLGDAARDRLESMGLEVEPAPSPDDTPTDATPTDETPAEGEPIEGTPADPADGAGE